jgi:hypothetical protein
MLGWEIKLWISVRNFIVKNRRGTRSKCPENAFDREEAGEVESSIISVCRDTAVLVWFDDVTPSTAGPHGEETSEQPAS